MLVVANFPTYSSWLGGRSTSLALRNQYNNARDAFERGRSTSTSRPSPRTTPDTPPYRGGGTRPSPGGPIPDTPPAPPSSTSTTPSRSGPPTRRFVPGSGSASPSPTPPSGGGGGGRTGVTPSGRGGSFGSGSGPSGYTGADPRNARMPRPSSFGSGSGPSGFGTTTAPVGAGSGSSAAAKGASAASKGASFATKAGRVVGKAGRAVGKVLNSPIGKMGKFVGGKAIFSLAAAKAAGDTFGAFEPGIDMLRYGHKAPYKDGVGGRDNRVNDMLGNISPLEMIKEGKTQEVLSNMTGGRSADFLKAVFPYRERPVPTPAPAAATPRTPSAPARPSAPAPQQPGSIPDMGRQGRAQSKAMRDPESYLGSAFDATLRKGIDTGRNYLRSQMNKDGLDSEDQSKIMARFDSKIAGDKLLKAKGNEQGLVGAINRNDATREGMTAGRGERTLEAYRTANYGKGAKAAEIQRKFVKQ